MICVAALFAAGGMVPVVAHGQIGGSGRLGGPRYQQTPESRVLLVTTLRSSERELRLKGTESLSQEIRARIPAKEVYLIPREQIEDVLRQSSFPLDTTLSALDARLLGRTLRADEYLDATIEPGPGGKGYQMSGRLYLMTDPFLTDVLPPAEPGDQLRHAALNLVNALKEVRKQLEFERECANKMREQKYAEAEAAARRGVDAYKDGTIVRVCLMAAIQRQNKGPDAVLAVAQEILQRDSLNRNGLAYAVDAYMAKGDTANYVTHAARLMSVDISNASMVENIVNTLAAMHRADVALPSIDRAILASPLEAPLHHLRIRLLIGAERWKDAAQRSEELARLDPEAADSAFYVRMAVAYQNDSQPDQAADALKRAADKFPDKAGLRLLYGQQLNRSGRREEAIGAYKQALQQDENLPGARVFIASAYLQMEMPDSTLSWLRLAHAAKDDTAQIAGMARSIGGRFLNAAQSSRAVEDYRRATAPFAFADSVSAGDDSKWFWAVAEFGAGQLLAVSLQTTPTCEAARESVARLEKASELIRGGGGRAGGQQAGTIMGSLNDMFAYGNAMAAEHCKTSQ